MQAGPLSRVCLALSFALLAVRGSTGRQPSWSAPRSLYELFVAGKSLGNEGRLLQEMSTVSNTSVFPSPVAFFPLSGNFVGKSNVSTTVYNGMGYNHSWDIDADAGTVLQCSKARSSRIELPPVRYGRQGPWAVNFWFKPSNEYGFQFQYLFSHNSTQFSNYTEYAATANQIRLYFPETGHPAYGILRALVKDSSDTANVTSHTDSDGRVGFDYNAGYGDSRPSSRQFLADGLWHMATLTTLRNSTQGYALLLDGFLVGLQSSADLYTVDNTTVLAGPDGGRPMMLDGKVVLCSHSDATFSANGSISAPGSRHYNGGISKLSIFDTALSPLHVQALHNQGVKGSGPPSTADAQEIPSQDAVKENGTVQAYPEPPPSTSLTPQQRALKSLPVPATFYPLSDGSLGSDPWLNLPPVIWAGGSINATFVEDADTFGRTLQCSKGAGSTVWLSPAPYFVAPQSGRVSITINLWFKADNTQGELFQYLLSQMGESDGSEWGPNQVAIYFPEQEHPRNGVVRAVVKDTNQANNGSIAEQMVYLDSDNRVADNLNAPMLDGHNPMTDGRWHMVTVTTQPDLRTGFVMFLDGVEVGGMTQGNYSGTNGTVTATGGGNMNLNTPFTLCQRADIAPYRGFDGRLSSLGIWTSVLTPANISALYAYGLTGVPYMGPYLANATSPDGIVTSSPAPTNPEPILPTTAPVSPMPAGLSAENQEIAAQQASQQGSKGSQLSGGAIAGIVVGVLAAFALASALAFMLFRRRKGSPTG
ncbi:hypothetical protein ABBQ32_002019 [Trebouxia sp. C0010 RCD-2024]